MKIIIPVDPEIPVPPKAYGGVERLVDGLITAYSKMGHEAILVAHRDSTSKHATRRYAWPALNSRGWSNVLRNSLTLRRVVAKENGDVIHSFGRLLYLYPSMFTSRIPFLMTYGRRISLKSTSLASFLGGKRMRFTAAAGHMLNHLGKYRHKFRPIYNFTPVDYFVPDPDAEKEHLMYLGRIEEIKGTKEAIDVALATGQKLIIAGNIQPGHEAYFESNVEPYLENPLITYVGPVDDEQKRYYLQRATAFLFPIKWEEPFGIVMAEAMACGTPLIGFRRGSVPEVIRDGENGFVVESVPQMIEALSRIRDIDRNKVRLDCVDRFSREVISGQYIDILQEMVKKSQ